MRSRVLVAFVAALVSCGAGAGVASADSPIGECIPVAAGGAITTPTSGTTCAGGATYKQVAAQADLDAAKARIAALEAKLQDVTRSTVNGQPTVRFSGVNVQVVNGSGSTSTVNGKGNLIVGYNDSAGDQSGSHNLILGRYQAATSWGSILGGQSNQSTGPLQVVLGDANRATANFASVLGGHGNLASSRLSVIAGGCENVTGSATLATDTYCSVPAQVQQMQTVTGGALNVAKGTESSVGAGIANHADGPWSSVTGGSTNNAANYYSTVSGGSGNVASGSQSSVSGGYLNTTYGDNAAVSGGRGNAAYDAHSSVSGGCANAAGSKGTNDPVGACPTTGAESISGGSSNSARAIGSSISGGTHNVIGATNAYFASILGGCHNGISALDRAVDEANCGTDEDANVGDQTIVGGEVNSVLARSSSIVGGKLNQIGSSPVFGALLGGFGQTLASTPTGGHYP